MEKVNAGFLDLDKTDTMAMLFKDPPIFYEGRDTYVPDTTDFYEQKFPKISNEDKTWYIESFKSLMFAGSDSTFASNIDEWVDIESIIDWHIILLFSNNGDGIMKNFYLYKKDSDTPFRIAIWDYDASFGRDGDNEMNMGEKPLNWQRSVLLKRLVEIPETGYAQKLKERWFELREKNILTVDNFKKHIEANDRIIHDELAGNFERWPVDGKWYYDANGYRAEVDLMVSFMEKSLPKMDDYITQLGKK